MLTAASKDEDASVREAALRAIAIAKENGPDAEATNDVSVGVQDVGLDIDRDEIATEGEKFGPTGLMIPAVQESIASDAQ